MRPSAAARRAASSTYRFGPALHVVRWKSDELDDVIDAINGTGFGLTLGVHSRIDATIRAHCEAGEGGEYLRQPQPDWCGGGRAAVWWREPFGDGPKAGGAALFVAVCYGEDVHDEYDGGWRQCVTIDARRIAFCRRLDPAPCSQIFVQRRLTRCSGRVVVNG
jgi:hypothetical protein